MAVTVTPNLTTLSLAQDNTGGTWAGASGAFDTEVFYQGSASWYYQTPKNAVGDGNFTPTAAVDMSAAESLESQSRNTPDQKPPTLAAKGPGESAPADDKWGEL